MCSRTGRLRRRNAPWHGRARRGGGLELVAMVADIAGQFRIEDSCRDQNRRADADCDPARGADAGARSPWRRSARLHAETIETRAREGQFERAVLSKAELKS